MENLLTTRKAQHKLGKAVNKIKLVIFMESLDNLPEEGVPPTQDDPYGGSENKNMALARVRSSQGPGAVEAENQPLDSQR